MAESDAIRLSKTMAFLLRHRPEVGGLRLDADGWVPIAELCRAVSKMLQREVPSDEVVELVARSSVQRFEVEEPKIRALAQDRRRKHATVIPPDILFHATTAGQVRELSSGLKAGRDRYVYLANDRSRAWRVAHRINNGDQPEVLFIDAARARRHGVKFYRNRRNGLYLSEGIPRRYILNLQNNFGEQHSAGGIPMRQGPDGIRLALIRCTRRSGTTWEVAKGKLEPGESPEATAVREVQEEMGLTVDLRVTEYLGVVRYGFLAPGRVPRLKSVFMYLMEPEADVEGFTPSESEGIDAVRWFTPAEASRAVTHSSLIPVMRRLRDSLEP